MTWKKRDAEVVWLGNNWKKFAKFYSLDHQHLLMFKYERKSQFQVVICDQSFLEIGYPVFIGTFGVEEISDQSGNSREIFDGFSTPRNKRPNSSPQTERVLEPKSTGQRQNMTGGSKSQAIESEEPLQNTKSSIALKRAHAYHTENPSFIREMHPSHIGRNFLPLPPRFLTASEQRVESATLWVSEERTWDVKLNLNHSNGQISLKTGWKNFVKDNHLKLGDVCVFEQIKSAGVSFRVVIFRDGEELSPPQFQVIRKKRTGAQSNIPQKEGVDGNAQKCSTTTTNVFDGLLIIFPFFEWLF
ncbi:DNA-binding barrel domain superfamily [Sesbania bispinosa]|nr:DNA-binding barrel domain superfamily [Sesbania bispinosa]